MYPISTKIDDSDIFKTLQHIYFSDSNKKRNSGCGVDVYTNEFDHYYIDAILRYNLNIVGCKTNKCDINEPPSVLNDICFITKDQLSISSRYSIVLIVDGNKDRGEFDEQFGNIQIIYNYIENKNVENIKVNEIKEITTGDRKNKYIFPRKENIDMDKLQLSTEGRYSVSYFNHSKEIVKEIKKMKYNFVNIYDVCGGNMSDSINFALNFNTVVTTEPSIVNYNVCVNNLNVYNLKNVKIFNTVYNKDLIKKWDCNVIFFDPPWGGKNYKDFKSISLFLGNKNVADIIKDIMEIEKVKLIILKIPHNYAMVDLEDIKIYKVLTLEKFNVLFIKN